MYVSNVANFMFVRYFYGKLIEVLVTRIREIQQGFDANLFDGHNPPFINAQDGQAQSDADNNLSPNLVNYGTASSSTPLSRASIPSLQPFAPTPQLRVADGPEQV